MLRLRPGMTGRKCAAGPAPLRAAREPVRGKSKRDGFVRKREGCLESRAIFFHALAVLILRSVHAEHVPQIRTRVHASRRMRMARRALMLRDASPRAFAVDSPISRCDAPL